MITKLIIAVFAFSVVFVGYILNFLLGAKSDGDAPASSEEETPTAPDRGYQSDTDINKSPVHAGRSQSPLIVPVSPIGSPQNNSGGWILVT